MKRLKVFYYEGIENINANLELSSSWTLKAAELDDTECQRESGFNFLMGSGVKIDYEQAYIWSKKAADKGDAQAQFTIGIMYKRGFFEDGVNIDAANEWFEMAASQGFQLAIDELNQIQNS